MVGVGVGLALALGRAGRPWASEENQRADGNQDVAKMRICKFRTDSHDAFFKILRGRG